ncbi:MAG: methylated-DNA--[protein]-cysteine S-methyltransferase [Alphaproteobacteria bacterium]|nr:methylated-DNA--[protein]-cysteine S-methyltransferase [Alphaproteobacteria bacterium]
MEQHYHVFETAQGVCAIAWSGDGVTRFRLPEAKAEASARGMLRRLPEAMPATPPPAVAEAVAAAKRYFDGERIEFFDVPLDLDGQDAPFLKIYDAARRIGWGRTTTYGGLAKEMGSQGWEAARDVGQAMAKNPVPLIIPCHRVLAAGGKMGGFSAPGGTETKRRMLALEGVSLGAPAQGSLRF